MHIRSRPAAEYTLTASASTKKSAILKRNKNRFFPGFRMLTPGSNQGKWRPFKKCTKPVLARVWYVGRF